MDNNIQYLAKEIFNAGCLLFGDFILKSGVNSSFYIDLRKIIASPNLLANVTDTISKEIEKRGIKCDVLCGVPYTCIPVAAVVSVKCGIPLLLRRKEPKSYGTKQLVEGIFKPDDKCLVVEDVMTTGSSILETINDLKYAGLDVKDVFIILVRQVEKVEELRRSGFRIHYLFTINEFVDILEDEGLITEQQNLLVKSAVVPHVDLSPSIRCRLSYGERVALAENKVASRLFSLMHEKHTNLCVAVDLKNMVSILKLADEIGPYICMLKLHLDCIVDKTDSSAKQLRKIADVHNFVILEDRKLSDIGHVVSLQYSAISAYTGLVTAHAITGSHVLNAITKSDGFNEEESGVFLVAQLSSEDNYITPAYTQRAMKMAEEYKSIITGIVCQEGKILDFPGFIQLTPGVSLDVSSDTQGQQYRTPEIVIGEQLADVAVVGRGIVSASNPAETSMRYRAALWDAYLERISS